MDSMPVTSAAQLTFALPVLRGHRGGDALTPLTVLVKADDADGDRHFQVTAVTYDRERDEFVLTIDQSSPAPGACPFTMSHTYAWCGNERCRR